MPPLGEQCHAERGERESGGYKGLTYVSLRLRGGIHKSGETKGLCVVA